MCVVMPLSIAWKNVQRERGTHTHTITYLFPIHSLRSQPCEWSGLSVSEPGLAGIFPVWSSPEFLSLSFVPSFLNYYFWAGSGHFIPFMPQMTKGKDSELGTDRKGPTHKRVVRMERTRLALDQFSISLSPIHITAHMWASKFVPLPVHCDLKIIRGRPWQNRISCPRRRKRVPDLSDMPWDLTTPQRSLGPRQ